MVHFQEEHARRAAFLAFEFAFGQLQIHSRPSKADDLGLSRTGVALDPLTDDHGTPWR